MDLDLNDALEDMEAQNFEDADELQMGDIGEDFDNGDPYNEEYEE